ncbi:MAG: polyhydroxyalkanoate synthesis repressor PhaR [Rhodospirillaceae bacterium]|nr:MAG: polyhydroxyalkanoate synthesis repressor PhaR [Rhodospirillaceae bacterium]
MSRKKTASEGAGPITIKKYANRRLYNTATSSYVTLDDLCKMVKEKMDFVVYDAKTGEDLTRSVLTQIIVEEEAKGQNLLPINFLRQLIGFYGDGLQDVLPSYLECSMQSFTKNQDKLRHYMQDTFSASQPFHSFEEIGKQNMAIFERAMENFSPFAGPNGKQEPTTAEDVASASGPVTQSVHELQARLDVMQRQLEELAKKSSA